MNSYKDLIKQREELDRQIEEARKRDISDAVTKVRAMIAEHGLSAQEVFPAGSGGGGSGSGRRTRGPSASAGSKVAPKYRHPDTGATWTGRGKAPRWIADQDRSKFAI